MAYFEHNRTVRIDTETQLRINKLLALYPDKYQDMSHLLRVGLIRLYNMEVDLNGNRKN